MTNKPWTFTIVDPTNVKLHFNVLRNDPVTIEGHKLVGRGMALLDKAYQRSYATR